MSTADETSHRRTDVINRESLRMLSILADLTRDLAKDDGVEAAGMAVTIGITATLGLVLTIKANWGVQFSPDVLRAEFDRIMQLEPRLYDRGPDGSSSQPHIIQ